jgi:hypothetical protein
MAQRYLSAALLDGGRIKYAAPKSGAQGTIGLSLRYVCCHDREGVFLDNSVRDISLFEVIGQYVFGEIGLFLVQIYGEDLKIDRRPLLDIEKQVEERVAVLTA